MHYHTRLEALKGDGEGGDTPIKQNVSKEGIAVSRKSSLAGIGAFVKFLNYSHRELKRAAIAQ